MFAHHYWIVSTIVFLTACSHPYEIKTEAMSPAGAFVSISDIDPSIVLDIRYYGSHNFVGRPVRGYKSPKCILTREAATALKKVQSALRKQSMSLKIYDCYRPQQGVNHFVEWAKDVNDTVTKDEFYPKVDKRNLFKDGYIASRSGHSRGSTVDLTIVRIPTPKQQIYKVGMPLVSCTAPVESRFGDNTVDMGTGFDCFDPLASTENPGISETAKKNRRLLLSLMRDHGFSNYEKEWWHYTLKNESFPDTFFDFVVE